MHKSQWICQKISQECKSKIFTRQSKMKIVCYLWDLNGQSCILYSFLRPLTELLVLCSSFNEVKWLSQRAPCRSLPVKGLYMVFVPQSTLLYYLLCETPVLWHYWWNATTCALSSVFYYLICTGTPYPPSFFWGDFLHILYGCIKYLCNKRWRWLLQCRLTNATIFTRCRTQKCNNFPG